MRLANERESNETSGARVPWLVLTLHETSKGFHRDERPSSILRRGRCRGTQAERSQKWRRKNGASPRSRALVHSQCCADAGWLANPPARTDESRGEKEILPRKARSGVDGLSTLRVIERLSLPSDTLVGGCPWRCSGSDLHVESREQSWRRPPVTPCGSLCARCAPAAAKLLRESLTCCFHTTRDSSDASVTHA